MILYRKKIFNNIINFLVFYSSKIINTGSAKIMFHISRIKINLTIYRVSTRVPVFTNQYPYTNTSSLNKRLVAVRSFARRYAVFSTDSQWAAMPLQKSNGI